MYGRVEQLMMNITIPYHIVDVTLVEVEPLHEALWATAATGHYWIGIVHSSMTQIQVDIYTDI